MRKSAVLFISMFIVLVVHGVGECQSFGTAFTYQGRLSDGGSPANDQYDFEFKLFNASMAGDQYGITLTKEDIRVSEGYFTVELDFVNDPNVFNGEARWLQISVRPGTSTGSYTLLSPRQEITATPYALQTRGIFVDNNFNVGIGTNDPDAKLTVAGALLRDGSTMYGTGANTHINLGSSSVTGTDGQNISYATVSGGISNTASGGYSTAGGGNRNVAGHWYATISGGGDNSATALYATIGGGNSNIAGGSTSSTVGGGWHNTAGNSYATVPGGYYNDANGQYSYAAGRQAKANHDGTFVWADSTDADFVSTANDQFLIRASGGVGIGTANPDEELTVNGTVKATSFIGDGSGLTGLPIFPDSDWTVSGNDMYSNPSGNIGIGTSSPDEKLTVVDGTIKASTPDSTGIAIFGDAYGTDYDFNFGGYFTAAGELGRGVFGGASGSYGRGVLGIAEGSNGKGLSGTARGSNGQGVFGEATDDNNTENYGGFFKARGGLGRGVYGIAVKSTNVTNYGGYFEAGGYTGIGIYGHATSTNNETNYGGYFLADNTTGRGVYGEATHTGNYSNSGGYFLAAGETGRGVYGEAGNTGIVENYGGYFVSKGNSGRGVYGEATGTEAYGVYGYASNTSDTGYRYGGFFEAAGLRGIGVYGKINGNEGIGVYGSCGVYSGTAVQGFASASGTGVYGNSYNGIAIRGKSTGGWAGSFEGNVIIQGGLFVPSLPYGDRQNAQWDILTGLFYYDNSSKRYKENIQPIQDDFSKILSVSPKTYTRPQDPNRWEIGYIAEDFAAAGLEKLVWFEDEEHTIPNGINYEKVVLYTNEIVKEHREMIQALHTQVDEQQKQIEDLLRRIATQEGSHQSKQFLDVKENR